MLRELYLATSLLTVVGGSAHQATLPAAELPFRVGEAATGLKFPSIEDGREMSIADFRGRKRMLHVWASW